MSWSNKKHLLDAHVVGVDLLGVSRFQVFVEVDHLLISLVQLVLVLAIQELPRVLEAVDLVFDFVQLEPHSVSVCVMHFGYFIQALLKLFLAVHRLLASALHTL